MPLAAEDVLYWAQKNIVAQGRGILASHQNFRQLNRKQGEIKDIIKNKRSLKYYYYLINLKAETMALTIICNTY